MSPSRIILIFALLVIPLPALGVTWEVEKDGSGDFSVIQDAVNSSSPGDTILIGPGRFEESEIVYEQQTYVVVEVDSLTFLGAGPEFTQLGPVSPQYEPGEAPIGIFFNRVTDYSISGISIESMYCGIYSYYSEDGSVVDCHFTLCKMGYYGSRAVASHLSDCTFVDNDRGLQTYGSTQHTNIERCFFTGSLTGAAFETGSENIMVSDCRFIGNKNGMMYASGSFGTVSNCVLEGIERYGVIVTTGGSASLFDNSVDSCGYFGLYAGEGGIVSEATGNVFYGGGISTIGLYTGLATMHGNAIYREPDAHFVHCDFYSSPVEVNLTNNYWGTSDLDEIAEWIHDVNDSPEVLAEVIYAPIMESSTPAGEGPPPSHGLCANPNPFNPRTTISFTLAAGGDTHLEIVDFRGRRIVTLLHEELSAGYHEVLWDGRDSFGREVSSGTYISRLKAGQELVSGKLTLVR